MYASRHKRTTAPVGRLSRVQQGSLWQKKFCDGPINSLTMNSSNTSEQLQAPLLSSDAMNYDDGEFYDEAESNQAAPAMETLDDSEAQPMTAMREPEEEQEEAWYHNPHQLTAMVSNFSTSYNVVNISLVLPILERLHNSTEEDAAACASSLLAGMIIGQLVGGALGDSFLGRLGALRLVMALQIIASLASALLYGDKGDIYFSLAIWRFILGVGAGGVYPLAAVLSAEQGSKHTHSSGDQVHRVVLTFSTQGLGFLAVPIVAVSLLHMTTKLDLVWRLILGFGSVPGIFLMLLQCKIYANERSELQAVPLEEPDEGGTAFDEEEPGAIQSIAERRTGWWESIRHEPGLCRKVVGTAGSWFLFDIVFYGNTIFQPIVVESAFGATESTDPLVLLRETAVDSLILTSIALPGYFVAGMIMGKHTCCLVQTPRYVMLQGFAAMGVLYFTIGINWTYLRKYPALLVFLYGMTFFFANYGPNTTTFILPSLLYSPECRSTWNGISAASGKLGALLGATLFEPAAHEWGDSCIMLICAALAIFGCFLTYFFVPKEDGNQSNVESQSSEEPMN